MLKQAFIEGFKKEAGKEELMDKAKAMAYGTMGPPGTGLYEAKSSKNEDTAEAADRGMMQSAIPSAAGVALGALIGGGVGSKMGKKKISQFFDDVKKVRKSGKLENEVDMVTDFMRSNRVKGANDLDSLNNALKEIKNKKEVLKPMAGQGEVNQALQSLDSQHRQVQEEIQKRLDNVDFGGVKADKVQKGVSTGGLAGLPIGGAAGGYYASTQRPEN